MQQNHPCSLTKLVIIIILFSLLSGFSLKQPTYTPTPVTPTGTSTPLTYEPSSIIHGSEPVQSPAINPPDFANDKTSHELGAFDLVSANAVYGLYRMENGSTVFKDEADFIEKMEAFKSDYMKKNGIELIRGSKDGVADSAVIRKNADGTYDMMRSLVAADGAIAYPEASYFDPSTVQEWINLPGRPELSIGEDKHSYTGVEDANGVVTQWLNVVGANRDNIADQLVAVTTADSAPAAGEPAPAANASEGAAKTADGASVIVEGGKLYKVDASGAKTETELSREVFTDVFEAGDLVKQLHPELFEGDQKALLDFLLPPETVKDGIYDHSILKNRWSHSKQILYKADVVGEPLEVVTMKAPEGYPVDSLYVMMMAVNGLDEPLPVIVGAQIGDHDALYIPGSDEWNLFQNRGAKANTTVLYGSLSELEHGVLNQRVELLVPTGALSSDQTNLEKMYPFMKHKEYFNELASMYAEKYGAVVYGMRDSIYKDPKATTGDVFKIVLDKFEADAALKSNFMGFLPLGSFLDKYLPQ